MLSAFLTSGARFYMGNLLLKYVFIFHISIIYGHKYKLMKYNFVAGLAWGDGEYLGNLFGNNLKYCSIYIHIHIYSFLVYKFI